MQDRETTWRFRVAEKVAQHTQITLEEDVVCWARRLKTLFYGYKTPKPIKATIWGSKVDLEIKIAPLRTPTETLPVAPKVNIDTKSLSEDKQERLDKLNAQIAEIKAVVQIDVDEALENRYWDYIDRELFMGSYLESVDVWSKDLLELSVRCKQVGELLVKMYDSVRNLQLPDDLMRNDTKFNQMIIQMFLFVEEVNDKAQAEHIALPQQARELFLFLDRLSDLLVEGNYKLFDSRPEGTNEEMNELINFISLAFNDTTPVDERLEILNRLCESRLVCVKDRLAFLEKSIELICNGTTRPKPAPCPHGELIKQHLSGISRCLQKLEQEGGGIWCERVAEEMFDSLKRWREDAGMAAWTKEQFIRMLYLTSASVSTHEQENGGVNYELNLFFLDKEDSFEGHTIFVSVKNEMIHEIALMG